MIGFRINEEWLQVEAGTSIQVELHNPLFNTDFEKGMLTYDLSAPASDHNRRVLKHAGSLSIRSYGKQAFDCQMWLSGQLWRIGKLTVLERGKNYKLSFASEAGALDTLGSDKLRSIDLSGAAVAYPTVKNEGWQKDSGIVYMNNGGVQVPFPYLKDVLVAAMAHYGYTVTGSWLTDTATQGRTIFNVVQQSASLNVREHVPDLTVGEFLKAVKKRYGLALLLRPKTRELELVKLADALADTAYDDWTSIAYRGYGWQPNTSDGYTIKDAIDSSDELLKEQGETYGAYIIGNGREDIPTGIGTTLMEGATPVVFQKGGTAEDAPKFGFRVLANGQAEPTSSIAPTYTNWLSWKGETEAITRNVSLGIPHLLNLNPLRKVLIEAPEGTVKAFWEKIEFSISAQEGIKPSKVSFLKVMG